MLKVGKEESVERKSTVLSSIPSGKSLLDIQKETVDKKGRRRIVPVMISSPVNDRSSDIIDY